MNGDNSMTFGQMESLKLVSRICSHRHQTRSVLSLQTLPIETNPVRFESAYALILLGDVSAPDVRLVM
jgi:hypothetical protein